MPTNQKKKESSYTTNYELYLLDKNYKEGSNLKNVIEQAQNFFNGDQYPNANYNNMIRMTMNICRFSAQIKASKIVGTPIYFGFTADNNETDTTALRQFDEYNCSKLSMETSNYRSALNGYVNGTEVTFIRWDDDDTSYKGIYKGGLVEEHIDPLHFGVANPRVEDLQNQQWVMFWTTASIGALKAIIEGKDEKEIKEKQAALEGDAENGSDGKVDYSNINHQLVTLFTRFFRVDGEVYFMCSTKSVDIFRYPHPLSRKVGNKIIEKVVNDYLKEIAKGEQSEDKVQDYKIDYEDLIMSSYSNDAFTDKEYKEIKEKFSLYPFAKFCPLPTNDAFFGESSMKELIAIQKGLNFALSMILKCMENNAYNKIIVKEDALRGQVITNEPGQVITDYSGFTNAWGIKFAETQPMPNGVFDAASNLFAMARTVYSFSDVMDGSITNQDLSGYAVSQMIKQSNTSIEQQQKLFFRYNEEKAYIRLMYYKHYVDEAKYTYALDDGELDAQEQAKQMLSRKVNATGRLDALPEEPTENLKQTLSRPVHKMKVATIKGKDLYGVSFDIGIDAMQGVLDSQLIEQQFWDNMLLNNGLANIDPELLEAYIKASPNVSQRTKTTLQSTLNQMKRSENQQLKQQIADLAQKTSAIIDYAKRLEQVTGYQGNYLKNLTSEFTSKIQTQNRVIEDLQKVSMNPKKSEGQKKSDASRGIAGTAQS